MKEYFVVSLWITFIVVRIFSHWLHDQKNYNTKKDSSKTLTHFIRKLTGKDIHHIHIGILMIILGYFVLLFTDLSNVLLIWFGVGMSLLLDQVIPFFKLGDYFDKKTIFWTIILHIAGTFLFLI